jgi:hydrogenase expression/formation protein HypE
VVKPVFFPGGDIGSLAVCGTVNDLSVCGSRPLFLSLGLVIEEGLEMKALAAITRSIGDTARLAGVKIVTGDTKVVERGSCDRIFINTSGVGEVYYKGLSVRAIRPGDRIIVNGPVGDHAVSILSKREGLDFGTAVKSDACPLNGLLGRVFKASHKIRFARDLTRGGLATALNEICEGRKFGMALREDDVPVRGGVRQACELLGLDPLYLACEGRCAVIVAREDARKVLGAMRSHRYGARAQVVGEVTAGYTGKTYLMTGSGGKRLLDMPVGEQLPRIC